jgi:hypothetical protein
MATSAYPVIESKIRIGEPQHEENIKKWQPVLDRFSTALAEVSSEGKPSALDRHTKRGQLLGQSISSDNTLTCTDITQSKRSHSSSSRYRLTIPRDRRVCWLQLTRLNTMRKHDRRHRTYTRSAMFDLVTHTNAEWRSMERVYCHEAESPHGNRDGK